MAAPYGGSVRAGDTVGGSLVASAWQVAVTIP